MKNQKYLYFQDMHDDDIGGVVALTPEEFSSLAPFKDAIANCNPLPRKLNELVFDTLYLREKVDVDPDTIPEADLLTLPLC